MKKNCRSLRAPNLAKILCFATSVAATGAMATGTVESSRIAGGEIRITCTGNADLCDQRAARLCSIGYEVTSRKTDPTNPKRSTLKIRCD